MCSQSFENWSLIIINKYYCKMGTIEEEKQNSDLKNTWAENSAQTHKQTQPCGLCLNLRL